MSLFFGVHNLQYFYLNFSKILYTKECFFSKGEVGSVVAKGQSAQRFGLWLNVAKICEAGDMKKVVESRVTRVYFMFCERHHFFF